MKYTLPEEIAINIKKVAIQNLNKIIEKELFDLGQENILDFDNSINSFVGCCSFGTGHVESFIKKYYGKFKFSPLLQNDSRS